MLYATRAPGALSFSAPVKVSNPGLSLDRPGIAIASDGAAVVGWTGSVEKKTNGSSWTGAFAAVREAKGAFGPAQTLELAPCMRSDWTHAAINDAGQAVVSWTSEKPECESVITDGVRASYRAPGQSFQSPASFTPQTLAIAGGDAVSPSGTVIVSGRGGGALVAFKRMPEGSYGDRGVISEHESLEEPPAIATDSGGNLYAASYTRDFVPGPEEGDDVPEDAIVANFAPLGGGFAAESVLQTTYEEFESMPVIATAGDGQAAIIWAAGTVQSRSRAYLSMLQPGGASPPPSPPATPEGSTPPPSLAPVQATTSAGQTSTPPSTPATPSPTATGRGSVLGAIQKATGTAQQPPQLVVRGRVGQHVSAVVVRLFRGADVLRTAHAHIGGGHFRALLNVAELPRGRYQMKISLQRGRRRLSERRWVSLA